MPKLLISEDKLRGRRLWLRNGALVVEKIEPLTPEQVAQFVDAVLARHALSADDVESITSKRG